MKLYERQQKELDFFLENKYLYLCASTGWGKSFVVLGLYQQTKETVNILCPAHLISQWIKYCEEFSLPYAVCSKKGFKSNAINIVSIQWFTRNTAKVLKPSPALPKYKELMVEYKEKTFKRKEILDSIQNGCLVIDEFHRVLGFASEIYKILQKIETKGIMYLSATPIEHGGWDLYPAIRTNPQIYKLLKDKKGFKNATEFKNERCKKDPYETRKIIGMDKNVERFFRKLLHVRKHVNNEDELIKTFICKIEYPKELTGWIYRLYRNLSGIQAFTAGRQLLNLFLYEGGKSKDYADFSALFSVKRDMLNYLIENKISDKGIIFYEFTAEKNELEKIDSIYMPKRGADKVLEEVDKFLESDKKLIAFQYRQLGEGVRLSFAKDIIFYTVCISNKLAKQSAGRAMYAGRTHPIHLYRLITDHPLELKLLEMLEEKEKEVNRFMNLNVEEL